MVGGGVGAGAGGCVGLPATVGLKRFGATRLTMAAPVDGGLGGAGWMCASDPRCKGFTLAMYPPTREVAGGHRKPKAGVCVCVCVCG